MKLELTLHPDKYNSKPTDASRLSLEISSYPVKIELDALKAAVLDGQTWSALFSKCPISGKFRRSKANWLGQQVFAADLDNTMLTPSNIVGMAKSAKLTCNILHTTFSHTTDKPKYRAIFAFNELTKDSTLALSTQKLLAKIYDGDPAVCDVSRLYYGGKELLYFSPILNLFKNVPIEPSPAKQSETFKPIVSTRQKRALLNAYIRKLFLELGEPKDSRYMTIWRNASYIVQQGLLSPNEVPDLFVAICGKLEIYDNYDKNIASIAKSAAKWAKDHKFED